jgi:hypothetical protein
MKIIRTCMDVVNPINFMSIWIILGLPMYHWGPPQAQNALLKVRIEEICIAFDSEGSKTYFKFSYQAI